MIDTPDKIRRFKKLVRSGDEVGARAFAEEHKDDALFTTTLKLRDAVLDGSESIKRDALELLGDDDEE